MFNLKVTEDEIQDVLDCLTNCYTSGRLDPITRYVFGGVNDIDRRKVRLCIKELRKRGYLIIAKRGYSMAGEDPEPVIHFINGMYSRAHSLTTDADIMYHGLKQKYGDAVSEKVQQMPGQPMLDIVSSEYKIKVCYPEPPFRKSIDARR